MPLLPEEQMARIDQMVAEAWDRTMLGIGVRLVQLPVTRQVQGTRFGGPLSRDCHTVAPIEITWDRRLDISLSVGEQLASDVERWARELAHVYHTIQVVERPHAVQATQSAHEEMTNAPLKFIWIAWLDLAVNTRHARPVDAPGAAVHVR